MEDDTEEVTEWTKLKKSLTVNKPLIPLKLTMLLYYGGNILVQSTFYKLIPYYFLQALHCFCHI